MVSDDQLFARFGSFKTETCLTKNVMKGKPHIFLKFLNVVLAALLAGWGGGCETAKEYSLTYKVWDNDVRSFCEPLANPDLALFEVPSKQDVLVQYTAYSDRHDGTLRLSYFLKASSARIAAGKPPVFVRVKRDAYWKAIPVNDQPGLSANSVSTNIYAKATGNYFTLYRQGQWPQMYQLPDYRDDCGAWERAALTPLAVTGDAVIVGSVLGVIVGYMYCASGAPGINNH